MRSLLFLFLLPVFCVAQDTTSKKSRFEEFYSADGKMFMLETVDIGKMKSVEASVCRITDLDTRAQLLAVRITQRSLGNIGTLTIDMDQVDDVNKALGFYLEQFKKEKPKNNLSFYYTTNNDICINAEYISMMNLNWYITIYKQYHYSKSVISGSQILLRGKDIDDFIELFKKAADYKFQ